MELYKTQKIEENITEENYQAEFNISSAQLSIEPVSRIENNAVNVFPITNTANNQNEKSLFNLKILVVEDDAINQKIARTFLEELGYQIDIAENGKQAVDFFKKNNYGAILMDIDMPIMNGINASRAIRRQEIGERTPIIALTTNPKADIEGKCLIAGMDAVATKPITMTELKQLLVRWYNPEKVGQNNNQENLTVTQQYLEEILSRTGYNITQIANESGIPKTTLIKLYQGIRKRPQKETFMRLLQFYLKIVRGN